jgi:hypothetical protein
MLFPEIDLIVPTAFDVAAACGNPAVQSDARTSSALDTKQNTAAQIIGKRGRFIHLLFFAFISST